jgi:hypothetical protein
MSPPRRRGKQGGSDSRDHGFEGGEALLLDAWSGGTGSVTASQRQRAREGLIGGDSSGRYSAGRLRLSRVGRLGP